MHDQGSQSSDHLGDAELLARERHERDDFHRLEQNEPQLRNTTFGIVRPSPALIASWERWWNTNLAARMRGILTRGLGR